MNFDEKTVSASLRRRSSSTAPADCRDNASALLPTASWDQLPLTILLNYKIVLALVWVVIIIWWLVLQVLPARPATLDQGEASRTVIQEPIAEPVLVTDTSTAVVKPNESQDED
jgi:hypothetical protein